MAQKEQEAVKKVEESEAQKPKTKTVVSIEPGTKAALKAIEDKDLMCQQFLKMEIMLMMETRKRTKGGKWRKKNKKQIIKKGVQESRQLQQCKRHLRRCEKKKRD
jgi:hypothetical protein